ncbi:MAG: PilZ domain-containing protein [Candidatus Omnitrophica bacterium]|nr:PilZ domain-containing protein [Candidatus Omnitrophota bacterium]
MSIERARTERRGFFRKNADFSVQLRRIPQESAGIIHNLLTHDFSEKGIQLSSFNFYPVNSKIILEMFPVRDMEPIITVGRVVWVEQFPCQERYKIGIEFSDMNHESRVHLKQIISSSNA